MLKQLQLIKRTIEPFNIQDSNPRVTPVAKTFLGKKNGKYRIGYFHYWSTVGSLSHLAGCTRPEMSVHQAAKFSTNPKHYQDYSVKRIGKCLKGKNYKGLILKTDLKKCLEIHVDADFAGACDKNSSEDP